MNMALGGAGLAPTRKRILHVSLLLGLAACSTGRNPTTASQKPLVGAQADAGGQLSDASQIQDGSPQAAGDLATGVEAGLTGSDIKAPEADIKAPQADIKTPEADIKTPEADIKAPEADIKAPEADIKAPEADIKAPEADIKAPEADIKAPEADIKAPEADIKAVGAIGACDPCTTGAQCSGLGAGAACIGLGEPAGAAGQFCAQACGKNGACPSGYTCAGAKPVGGGTATVCVPDAQACGCSAQAVAGKWTTPCMAVVLDAAGNVVSQCKGTWSCNAGGKALCDAPEPLAETCNGKDDDCDGQIDDGGLCDDGNPCTKGDACLAGKCVTGANTCECQSDADCKPGADLCAGQMACSQGKCAIKAGSAVKCDASNDTACSQSVCDAKVGKCAATAQNEGGPCDADGNVCTVSDKCVAGKCATGKADTCDDANPCTTDACDKAKGCTHTPNSAACDDGNGCTGADSCKGGACAGGAAKVCDDANPCTADACDPKTGACVSSPGVNGNACDDADGCTLDDVCALGKCKGGKAKGCDDGNPCTVDACANGTCASVAGIGACDDGNACTQGDACKDSKCVSGGNVCECLNDADCTAKSDGNLCAGKHVCQANKCAIAVGTVVVCDVSKNDACATNLCNSQSGLCAMVSAAEGKACDDGSACTSGDACKSGACAAGAAVKCDDGNPCTDDSCDAGKGCVQVDNATPCDDTNACTLADACKAGACVGAVKTCSDGSDCTADSCDTKSGTCAYKIQAACVGKKWQRAVGSAEAENFYGVVHTSDGGFVAAGHTTGWSAGGKDAYLVKVDACGSLVWAKNYGGDEDDAFWGVTSTVDGGFIAVGEGATWQGTYVVKTDAVGNVQWQNVYGGGGLDFGRKIIQLQDGGYAFIVEQYTYSSKVGKTHKATIMKVDSAGTVVWVHTYGGGDSVDSEGDAPFKILEMDDGSLMVAGGEESDSMGDDDIWLFKLDKDGKHVASWLYGLDADDEAADLIRTSDGGFLMTGHTTGWGTIYHSKDIMLIKIGANMKVQWMKRWGGFDDDRGAACFETADGYVVTGRTASFGSSKDTGIKWVATPEEKYNPLIQFDMFYARTDKSGNLVSMKIYGNASTQYGFSGDVDTTGGFVFCGQTFGQGSGKSDGFLVKTDTAGDAGGSCDTKVLSLSTIDQATCGAKTKIITPQDFGGGFKLPSSFSPATTPLPTSTAICVCQ